MGADGTGIKTTAEIGIYNALIGAQTDAKQIEKDAKNSFHRYNYVSAEAMIHEAKGLLSKHGLALVPVSSDLSEPVEGVGQSDDDMDWRKNARSAALLRTSWLLVHKGGGTMPVSTAWPVAPEKGRPIDKAVAAARTASLSYLLRDILQIPRVEEGTDLDGDDRDEHRANAGPSEADLRKAIGAELDRLGEKTADARTARVTAIYGRTPKTLSELQAILDNLKTQPAPKG